MSGTGESVVYIPISSKLNNDIVRLSDGEIDASDIVEVAIDRWMEVLVEIRQDYFGDRVMEAAEIFAPDLARRWQAVEEQEMSDYRMNNKPLVWKELSLASRTEVRMTYDGTQHYATVKNGAIEDGDGRFSPSQWASKVAGGTTRNAWRDIWVKEPLASTWVPAELMRREVKEKFSGRESIKHDPDKE